jgi:hypothetical protein
MELEHETVVAAAGRMTHAIGVVRREEQRMCAVGHDLHVPAQVFDENAGLGENDRVREGPLDRSAIACRRGTPNRADAKQWALEQNRGLTHDAGSLARCDGPKAKPVYSRGMPVDTVTT